MWFKQQHVMLDSSTRGLLGRPRPLFRQVILQEQPGVLKSDDLIGRVWKAKFILRSFAGGGSGFKLKPGPQWSRQTRYFKNTKHGLFSFFFLLSASPSLYQLQTWMVFIFSSEDVLDVMSYRFMMDHINMKDLARKNSSKNWLYWRNAADQWRLWAHNSLIINK